jgi:integrase
LGCKPWRALTKDYLASVFDGKTEGYKHQVQLCLFKCETYLAQLKIAPRPRELTDKDILALYTLASWVSLHERHMVLTRLRPFLDWCGNNAFRALRSKLDLQPPTPRRQQYTATEIEAIRESAAHPYEKWLIHLETDYGARKVTVQRSRAEDFDMPNGVALLRVKGRGGTKTMEAPLHPDTPGILDAVVKRREAVIARCRAKGYRGLEPPNLLLIPWRRRPKPISGTALDNILIRLCERAGVKPRGHHANRRGVAKLVYDKTKDLVVTQCFLGHADPKTTEMYIGTGLDKQQTAQAALSQVLTSRIRPN